MYEESQKSLKRLKKWRKKFQICFASSCATKSEERIEMCKRDLLSFEHYLKSPDSDIKFNTPKEHELKSTNFEDYSRRWIENEILLKIHKKHKE